MAGVVANLPAMGTVRVLVVEDDHIQQMTLLQLFANANNKNAGVVTFDVSSERTPSFAKVGRETTHPSMQP